MKERQKSTESIELVSENLETERLNRVLSDETLTESMLEISAHYAEVLKSTSKIAIDQDTTELDHFAEELTILDQESAIIVPQLKTKDLYYEKDDLPLARWVSEDSEYQLSDTAYSTHTKDKLMQTSQHMLDLFDSPISLYSSVPRSPRAT